MTVKGSAFSILCLHMGTLHFNHHTAYTFTYIFFQLLVFPVSRKRPRSHNYHTMTAKLLLSVTARHRVSSASYAAG